MGLNDKALEFIAALKATPEFGELKKAKAMIDKDEKIRKELSEFNRKQKELLTANLPAKDAQARVGELNEKFKSLSAIPEVARYLKTSKQLDDVLTRALKMVNEALESELKF